MLLCENKVDGTQNFIYNRKMAPKVPEPTIEKMENWKNWFLIILWSKSRDLIKVGTNLCLLQSSPSPQGVLISVLQVFLLLIMKTGHTIWDWRRSQKTRRWKKWALESEFGASEGIFRSKTWSWRFSRMFSHVLYFILMVGYI